MERLKHVKGAIFDLDGTLFDSLDVWADIDRKFFARRGIPLPEDYMTAVNTMSFSEAAAYTIRRFGLNETPEELVAEWRAMSVEAYANDIGLKPHAKEFLLSLKARDVKLGIATVLHRDCYIPALLHNGIADWFDAITDTTEVARGKGFPDIYEKTAEKMGIMSAECAVFEDILPGIRGAKAGGFLTVAVYDKHSDSDSALIKALADIYLTDYGASET